MDARALVQRDLAQAGWTHTGAFSHRLIARDRSRAPVRRVVDPARPRGTALRDQADIALLRGDVSGPDEGP